MQEETFRQHLKVQRLEWLAAEHRKAGVGGPAHWHALGESCQDGEDLRIFKEMGGDINARSPSGEGLLDPAIRAQSYDYFSDLLASGLDHRQVDRSGVAPIFACIRVRAVRKARVLIELGLDKTATSEGKTPLFMAMESSVFAIARALMQQGYDPSEVGPHGKTLLHAALCRGKFKSGMDTAWVLKELLSIIPLSSVDASGVSADAYAESLLKVLRRSPWDGVVRELIDAARRGLGEVKGVDILSALPLPKDGVSEQSISPSKTSHPAKVMHARSLKAVTAALGRGEEINSIDALGRSALWTAASQGANKIGLFLLGKGARIGVSDNSTGNEEIHELARFAAPDFLAALLSVDPKQVHARNARGWTPLHIAVRNCRAQMCNLLLDAGASINAIDNKGNSPLHEAALELGGNSGSRLDLLAFLLDRGADPLLRNQEGCTALDLFEKRLTTISGDIPFLVHFMRRVQAQTVVR